MEFGERLKELRKEANITQFQLAQNINMSKMAISHWESGHSEPSIKQLVFLAEYFNVTVDYLVGKDE